LENVFLSTNSLDALTDAEYRTDYTFHLNIYIEDRQFYSPTNRSTLKTALKTLHSRISEFPWLYNEGGFIQAKARWGFSVSNHSETQNQYIRITIPPYTHIFTEKTDPIFVMFGFNPDNDMEIRDKFQGFFNDSNQVAVTQASYAFHQDQETMWPKSTTGKIKQITIYKTCVCRIDSTPFDVTLSKTASPRVLIGTMVRTINDFLRDRHSFIPNFLRQTVPSDASPQIKIVIKNEYLLRSLDTEGQVICRLKGGEFFKSFTQILLEKHPREGVIATADSNQTSQSIEDLNRDYAILLSHGGTINFFEKNSLCLLFTRDHPWKQKSYPTELTIDIHPYSVLRLQCIRLSSNTPLPAMYASSQVRISGLLRITSMHDE